MYKLKDIFTLNLNSRGGVKLFNKIANRYNLNKEDRKDLMNVEVGSSNVDDSDKYTWYKTYFKFLNPETGKELIVYPPLIADAKNLSMIFDRSVSYIAAYGGSGNGHAAFYGDIPLDLSYRYKKAAGEFLLMNSVGVRLNIYNYDTIDMGTGAPLHFITDNKNYESTIDEVISEYLNYCERKYDDKYLQYLHIITCLNVLAIELLYDVIIQEFGYYQYLSSYQIISKLKYKFENFGEMLKMYDAFIFIEPTTKKESLQIAKEQVENYINNN